MTDTATAPTEEQQPEQSKGNAALEWLKGQYALFILIVLLIIAAPSSPAFLTPTNITNLLLQMSIIGVVVLAELIIVLTGGIDISVGSALGLAAVLSAGLFGGFSVWFALLVALAVGGVIGLVNGWLVAFRGPRTVHRHPGHARASPRPRLRLRQGHPDHAPGSGDVRSDRSDNGAGNSGPDLIWIAMVVLVAFLLKSTVWGRRVYAIGSNKEAARSSGIPVSATLWSVYILAGLLVGLGGWMFLCRFGSATSIGRQPDGAGGHRCRRDRRRGAVGR